MSESFRIFVVKSSSHVSFRFQFEYILILGFENRETFHVPIMSCNITFNNVNISSKEFYSNMIANWSGKERRSPWESQIASEIW